MAETKKTTNKKNKGGNFKFYGLFKKYQTVDEVREIIENYFTDCEKQQKYPTITGLAFAIGVDRHVVVDYKNICESDKFKTIPDDMKREVQELIRQAYIYVESKYEDRMLNDGRSPIGTIFSLKNNFQWVERQEVVKTDKTIKVDILDDEE